MKPEPYGIYEEQIKKLIRSEERFLYLRIGKLIPPDLEMEKSRVKVKISEDTTVGYDASTYQLLKYLSGPRSINALYKYMEYFSIQKEFLQTLMDDHVVIRIATRSPAVAIKSFRGLKVVPIEEIPDEFLLEDGMVKFPNGHIVSMMLAQILYGKDDAVGTKKNSDLPQLIEILRKQSNVSRKKAIATVLGEVTREDGTYRCARGSIPEVPFLGLEDIYEEVTFRWFAQNLTGMLYDRHAILEWVNVPRNR